VASPVTSSRIPRPRRTPTFSKTFHDWNDQQCQTILRAVLRSAPSHARLLIAERILDPDQTDLGSSLVDITMLVMTGGKQRSVSQYAALVSTGFQLAEQISTTTVHSVLSARSI
jgi:hypothetical protein